MPVFARLLVCCSLLFALACQPSGEPASTSAPATPSDSPRIVFIRLDSLQNGYTELATEMQRLQDNAQSAEENIQKELASLQAEVQRLQNKIQRGEMTPKMIQREEQRIGGRQQEIAQRRDVALASIQQDQFGLQQRFGDRVKEILEEIQAEKGYDYILNEGGGSGVLLGRDEYDITGDVLERLNALPAMARDSVQ